MVQCVEISVKWLQTYIIIPLLFMASDLAQVNINTYCNSMAYYYTFKSSQQICPITALRLAITVL